MVKVASPISVASAKRSRNQSTPESNVTVAEAAIPEVAGSVSISTVGMVTHLAGGKASA
jgi:hypothetical protein